MLEIWKNDTVITKYDSVRRKCQFHLFIQYIYIYICSSTIQQGPLMGAGQGEIDQRREIQPHGTHMLLGENECETNKPMCMFNNFMSGKYCEEVKASDDTEGRGRKKMASKKVFLNRSKKEWSSKRGTF